MTRRGEDSEWRKRFFKSVYDATNEEVYGAEGGGGEGDGPAGLIPHARGGTSEAAKERAFHKWMAKQQTYYRELLKVGGRVHVCGRAGEEGWCGGLVWRAGGGLANTCVKVKGGQGGGS